MRQLPTTSRSLSRPELAQKCDCSLTTIDRLIAKGLAVVGHRGRAKLYDPQAARRLARTLKSRPSVAPKVLRDDYLTHAEDFRDRRRGLLETWVSDDVWVPVWRQLVAAVSKHTASWPGRLADRLGNARPEDRDLLSRADGPRPEPPVPSDHLTPKRLLELLAGPVGAHPWRPAALPAIAALAARGQGIDIRRDGAWLPWDPADGISVPIAWPAPVLRPLMNELAAAMEGPVSDHLEQALVEPAARRSPRTPTGADAAREAWRRARADFRRARVAIRRGHRRRVDVAQAIAAAVDTHTRAWWASRHSLVGLAGDRHAVLEAAERLQVRTLHDLDTLGGLLPAEHPRRRTSFPQQKETR